MAVFGGSVPIAILDDHAGRRHVTPVTDEWWVNFGPLRVASQAGCLFCPDCGERLVFRCGTKITTPHFKHLAKGCTTQSTGGPGSATRRTWDRHRLVLALRSTLPDGTNVDCHDFLFLRQTWMHVALPDGTAFVLEVAATNAKLEDWREREAACLERGLPVFYVFMGEQVPHGLSHTRGPRTLTALKPDHNAVARPLAVDKAHVAAQGYYGLPGRQIKGVPRTLYFFRKGRGADTPDTLAILRGLIPDPDPRRVNHWYGHLILAPMEGHGQGRLRFSPRRGFYTPEDLTALRQYHDIRRLRRRQRRAKSSGSEMTSAVTSAPPSGVPQASAPAARPQPLSAQPAVLQQQTAHHPMGDQSDTGVTRPRVSEAPDVVRCRHCGTLTPEWFEKSGGEGTCYTCHYRRQGIEPTFCPTCNRPWPSPGVIRHDRCPRCR